MELYVEDRRQVPAPSAPQEGERLVELPPSTWGKVLLPNEQLAHGVSNAELARRMGTRPQEMQRITDLAHATKIDTLADAFRALGKRLVLTVE